MRKFTNALVAKDLAPWLKERPKGDLAWDFAYWPSYAVAKTTVDTDFFGIKDELASATAFEVSVAAKGQAKPIVSQHRDMKDKVGTMVLKGLDLAEGDYTATLKVFGPTARPSPTRGRWTSSAASTNGKTTSWASPIRSSPRTRRSPPRPTSAS